MLLGGSKPSDEQFLQIIFHAAYKYVLDIALLQFGQVVVVNSLHSNSITDIYRHTCPILYPPIPHLVALKYINPLSGAP